MNERVRELHLELELRVEARRKLWVVLAQLGDERIRGRPQRSSQVAGLKAADERRFDGLPEIKREPVGATSEVGLQPESYTRERDHVVADCADQPFRLPRFAALDAGARVQDVVPAEPDLLAHGRRRRRLLRPELTEDGSEARAISREMRSRREAEVDLEAARQQEDAERRSGRNEIPVVQGAELTLEERSPIVNDA